MALDRNSNVSPGHATGTYTGTTASQTITCGFQPSFLIIYNQTDGDDVNLWHKSSLTNFVNIALAPATEAAAITTTDHGFVLPGTNTSTNENTKTFVFVAIR